MKTLLCFTLCNTKLLIALRWTHAHKHTLLRVCLTSINIKTFQKVYWIFSLEENFHTSLQIFDTCSKFFAMKLVEEPSMLGNSIGANCFVVILPKFVSSSQHVPLGSQNKVLVDQNMQKIASNTSVRVSCLSHYFMFVTLLHGLCVAITTPIVWFCLTHCCPTPLPLGTLEIS